MVTECGMQAGDVVRIIEKIPTDIESRRKYVLVPAMYGYEGREVVIRAVRDPSSVYLKDLPCYWHTDLLEPINDTADEDSFTDIDSLFV